MSLYLKYRPKTVDELDLTGVRESFNKLINSNVVSHAYLFTGPRGAGKTSSARILARIVNCEKNKTKLGEPCNECSACKAILMGGSLDFIEIDAASNRGIDDIRELKEKIRLAPSELKYKVYIIDEVHMLTTEAFNALLKTLEEPPSSAIFILCTTETHKVPETIQSRCVSVGFTKATPDEMKRSFARVISGEGKKVSEEALDYLSRSVDGSFRDGVKILDKVLSNSSNVSLAEIEQVIMGVSGFSVVALANALVAKSTTQALDELHQATARGVDLVYLTVALMKELRNRLLAGESKELVKLVFNLDDVARKVATSPVPELLLEMVVIDWGLPDGSASGGISQAPSRLMSSVKSDNTKISDPVIKMESGEAKGGSVDEAKSPWMQMKEQFLTGKKVSSPPKPTATDGPSVTIDEAIEIFS